MRPIVDVAKDAGLAPDALEAYGRHMAKVPLESFPEASPDSQLVIVTAMSPTPLGEGKTTTSIGLVQGLARIGRRPVLTLRQPSIGPLFGIKGWRHRGRKGPGHAGHGNQPPLHRRCSRRRIGP